MRQCIKKQIGLVAVVFGISFMTTHSSAEHKRLAEKKAKNTMNSDTISIPTFLLDHLLSESNLHEWLIYLPSLDVEDEPKVYPAYAVAERAAKEKQRAASTKGPEKIKLKTGQSVTIRGLGKEEIESCVAVFTKNLPRSISKNDQKVLVVWAKKGLLREFFTLFTVQLRELPVTKSSDGRILGSATIGVMPMPRIPAFLAKYRLEIQPYSVDGKPEGDRRTVFPDQIMEGKRYDFLTIETEDEAPKPAPEKPEEAFKKQKSR